MLLCRLAEYLLLNLLVFFYLEQLPPFDVVARLLLSELALSLADVPVGKAQRMVYCIFLECLCIAFFVLLLIFNSIPQDIVIVVFSLPPFFFIIFLHLAALQLVFLSDTVGLQAHFLITN